MFSLHIERCIFFTLTLASSFGCQSGAVVCGPWYVVVCHGMLWYVMVCLLIVMPCYLFIHPCLYSESNCVTVVCIILSRKPLFTACSAFSLPSIPVWTGVQLKVGLCVTLDAASLMNLVISPVSYCLVCSLLSKSLGIL